jgi:hypothetical protein
MSAYDLILIVLVGAGAFYAGYQLGRFKALSERVPSSRPDDDSPLPGPGFDRPLPESAPSRPRGTAPPASAGNDGGSSWSEADAAGRLPPRRSTKPPPAAAGLMDKGSSSKRD